jgi:cell division protein FtsI/penicillin-binding protein 2
MPKRANKTRKTDLMQTAFTRFMLIVAFLVLWIGGIGIRLVHLQITQHEILRTKALNQRRDTIREKQLRGTIYDRSGRALAMSVKAKTLYANPFEIADFETTARETAKVLKMNPHEISAKLKAGKENNKKFVILAPKLDEEQVQLINESLEIKDIKKADLPKFTGLHWSEDQKRSYPHGSLAAHIIGFSNAEDIGSAGIEQSQEKNLRGTIIKAWQDRDRLGRVYNESEEASESVPPKDVYLTIDHSIQHKVEKALEQGVKSAKAKSGIAIVLNPRTGEILAMANYPTFDPNRYKEFDMSLFINRATQSAYSPGSVFKLITYGAAINEGIINPDGEVDCGNGILEISGRNDIVDKHCKQTISYSQAMAVSSNIVAMKIAQQLGKEKFYFYSQKFGFGMPTGVELPAETKGILNPPKSWSSLSLTSMSIGYEINVTALQMATAFATIANDGLRVQPHIIKEIKQADGTIFPITEPEKTQVVSVETARHLKKMLREVVLSGTGKQAQLNGYTSAGKTGTAWKYDPKLRKINPDKYVSSFIGFAPVDNPEIVIAIVLDEPQVSRRDGGQVAAPVFREIAEQILPELNVVPDNNIRRDVLIAENMPSETETGLTSKTKTATKAVNDKQPPKEQSTGKNSKESNAKSNAIGKRQKNKSSGATKEKT